MDKKTKKEIKKIIFRFLDPKKYQVFVFGSRVFRGARKFSDVDIGIIGRQKVNFSLIEEIKEAFEESDFPYNVDVVDFNNVSKDFKKLALKKTIKLN